MAEDTHIDFSCNEEERNSKDLCGSAKSDDIQFASEPLVSPMKKSKENRIHIEDVDNIAQKLLAGKFLLSALELHTELVETGRELPRLKEFFSNPNNFEHQSRLDPLLPIRMFILLTIHSRVMLLSFLYGAIIIEHLGVNMAQSF